MMAENDDLLVPVELGQPAGNFAHGDQDGSPDRSRRVLGRFAHVEEHNVRRILLRLGRRGIDLEGGQNPSRMLVTSDCAKRPASASIATFSRSEKFDDPTPPPAMS